MDDEIDGIVRRDFPPSGDGYDRAAVDAHLEAVAARVAAAPGAAADHELVGAGRILLAEIAAVRGELKRVSDALRDRSATIARRLDQLLDLDAEPAAPGTVHPPAADPLVRLAPPPVEVAGDAPLPPPAVPQPAAPVGHDPPAPPAQVEVPGDDAPFSASLPVDVDVAVDDDPPPAAAAPVDAAALADARLVALDMALGGSSRGEIVAELSARFELADPPGLTDEVLAAIG